MGLLHFKNIQSMTTVWGIGEGVILGETLFLPSNILSMILGWFGDQKILGGPKLVSVSQDTFFSDHIKSKFLTKIIQRCNQIL